VEFIVRIGKARILAVLTASALGLGVFAANSIAATSLSLKSVGACCKFDKKTLTAKAGSVTITFKNNSGAVKHNIAIKGSKKSPVIAGGKTTKLTVTLKKGTYTFYCSVPGHEASGMKGTLKVS
jgi:uncharacterized cupredoxin-like copper-binding protein